MPRVSRRSSKLWIYESNSFKCKETNSNGRSCSATFTHLSSVKRHITHQHRGQNTTFVMCVPGSKPRRTRHHNPVISSTTTISTSRRVSAVQPIPSSFSVAWGKSVTRNPSCCHLPSRSTLTQSLSPAITQASVSAYSYSRPPLSLSAPSVSSPMPMAVRIPGDPADTMPTYEVKRSRKAFEQKALDWLSASGKSDFDQYYTSVFADWGRKYGSSGPCTILPEDWRQSSPLDLMALFSTDNYPSSGATRAAYSRFGHATTLARAAAWFNKWPRTGVELDNFLGCGPYKPMDASHLCHHEHCIRHITYEPAHINQDRKRCCERARFLRQENRDVPEHCTSHSPPCMMQVRGDDSHVKKAIHTDYLSQHAALTALEVCYIQFDILRQAYGIPATEIIPRPRRYPYRTFESQLPCVFPAVKVTSADLQRSFAPLTGRPELTCPFCLLSKVKAFASIVGFWAHIVHRHQAVSDDDRLCEVRRSAASWQTYWNLYSSGGKRNNLTVAKLRQALRIDFSWTEVLDWQLR